MRYKNITDGVLRFKAKDSKGIKKVFVLKPEEEFESESDMIYHGGIEKISEKARKGKSSKKNKGDY